MGATPPVASDDNQFGTIGTRLGKYVPRELIETGLGVVSGPVGLVVLVTEFFVP